jgi:hypothetical protein
VAGLAARTLQFPPFKYLLDLIKTEIGLRCKFAHLAAKGIAVSPFFQIEEKPLGQIKRRTLSLGHI